MTFTVLGLSGSLRAASSNTGLIRMAIRLAPAELFIEELTPLDKIPFYNVDLDTAEALPPIVASMRAKVLACDALILAAPEYNFGPSGVLKNAIDWLTRPPGEYALKGKVVAIVGSGGRGGGLKVQAQLNEILGILGNTIISEPTIGLVLGATYVSSDGSTTNPEVEELITARLAAMVNALLAAQP